MTEILNRLRKKAKHLRKWSKREATEAYRVYDRDIPDYPYQIDVYADCVVLYDRSNLSIDEEKTEHFDHTLEALQEVFQINLSHIFVKSRLKQKGDDQYKKMGNKAHELIVKEDIAKFKVNLSDYLDTGLFLDHRPLRKKVYQEAQHKQMLNLFSYTCSIGVCAALAGAETTNVDLSNTYLEWGMENYRLNEINPGEHRFVKADVKIFLEEDENKYDLIVLDPPTFSNSKSMDYTFDIQKLAGEFIHLCINRLNDDGVLYFSTNKRDFKWDTSWETNLSVKDISLESIPEDYRDKKIHKLYRIQKINLKA